MFGFNDFYEKKVNLVWDDQLLLLNHKRRQIEQKNKQIQEKITNYIRKKEKEGKNIFNNVLI